MARSGAPGATKAQRAGSLSQSKANSIKAQPRKANDAPARTGKRKSYVGA